MDLKTLLGDQYKEEMTHAEIKAALAGVVVYTEEEVKNNFVSKKLFDKTASDLAAAKKGGKATADDLQAKLDAALESISTMENERKQEKREAAIAKDTAAYVAMGYSAELAKSTAEAIADGDTAKINANTAAFITQQKQALREEFMKGTQLPAAGGSASGGTNFAKDKADALARGDDATYMRLCREEVAQAAQTK